MSTTTMYYFSGTGNTLFVAKELQKRLPDSKLIPIVSLLDGKPISVESESVGLVFPLHGMTLPVPFQMFLRKADLSKVKYLFAICNRGGTKCFAFRKIERIVKRRLNLQVILSMPNNDPKFETYPLPTPEEFAKYESDVRAKLDAVFGRIQNREEFSEKDTTFIDFSVPFPLNKLLERLVLFGMWSVNNLGLKDYFYADNKCTGCGSCAKACPSGKVKMIDGAPMWGDSVKCFFCYACVTYCPAQSVQIASKWYMKSYTQQNGRYPHPYAGVTEISAQKKGIDGD